MAGVWRCRWCIVINNNQLVDLGATQHIQTAAQTMAQKAIAAASRVTNR